MTQSDPFADLAAALSGGVDASETAGVRIDASRRNRTGSPEVVYGKGKSAEQIAAALRRLLDIEGRALAARIGADQAEAVQASLVDDRVELMYDPIGRTLAASVSETIPVSTGGRVGLISAGSSDRPQISEAAAILHEMGCRTQSVHDVGVAGLHRLVAPLRQMMAFDPDALIVAAGMDGVLPGVISGLVAIPVVALPTSTGYGFGGEGLGAMTTMLQACAPGIAVVNIDNGIGAGVVAGLIANRAASQRSS
ncbi:MAG TPA: nickel pincer cofactor biosynthesis protein LarB [Thermomicrobiales bacterium]|nr:nickel pincer cofactor biosynthesis protein LarB [Thermomicrobiales bacterium]